MIIEHQPPMEYLLNDLDSLYFLDGPIQGAPDWQQEAVNYIAYNYSDLNIHIANPRRNNLNHEFIDGSQVKWEDYHRQRAAKNGAVIFWLAARDNAIPLDKGSVYAAKTRFEFAKVFGWLKDNPSIRIGLGIEDGYKGNKSHFSDRAVKSYIPVFTTLADTCDFALDGVK
jgi:hypothetical protein